MNKRELEKVNIVAARLAELGHPTRLNIFKLLVKCGNDAVSVGDIQQEIGIPNSTLSHHIAKMVKVGLIKQIRESRTLYCIPQFEALEQVIGFLQDECCVNQK
jgi:DNA-binding transcriptional ArsR family regulator